MKKLLAVLMAVLLVAMVPLAMASELGLNEKTLTLPQKLQKQIADGSGLKGTISFEIAGDTFLGSLLGDGLHEAAIEFTHILTDKLTGDAQTNITVKDGETVAFTAGVDTKADALLLTGSFFGGTPLKVDVANYSANLFPDGGTQGKTSWEVILYKLFFANDEKWQSDMNAALSSYGVQLELWLSNHAKISNAQGSGVIDIEYVIDFRSVADEMTSLMSIMLQDATLRTLLEKKLTKEEMDTYFNLESMELYKIILDNVKVEGDLTISQKLSTRDNQSETKVLIPLAKNAYGFEWAQIIKTQGGSTYGLTGKFGSASISFEETATGTVKGLFHFMPKEKTEFVVDEAESRFDGVPMSIGFEYAANHKEEMDEEKKNNTYDTHTLSLAPDLSHLEAGETGAKADEYLDFAPVTFTLDIHYRSGTAKTSATTLTVGLTEKQETASAKLSIAGKTSSPWQLDPRDWETAKAVTAEEGIGAFVTGIVTLLGHFTPAMLN